MVGCGHWELDGENPVCRKADARCDLGLGCEGENGPGIGAVRTGHGGTEVFPGSTPLVSDSGQLWVRMGHPAARLSVGGGQPRQKVLSPVGTVSTVRRFRTRASQ